MSAISMPNSSRSTDWHNLKSARKIVLPCSTPLPDFLLDHVMPLAPHPHWKVLLVIWRKTVGWDKHIDCISLSQLQRGAGVCRDTVLAAVKFWEAAGLVSRIGRSGFRGTVKYQVL